MKILVTGGAGFIGSNFVRLVLRERDWNVVVLDKLTYAGRRDNIPDDARVSFIQGDICDAAIVAQAMNGCAKVFNFAAESHVDRSLMSGDASSFVHANVLGVTVLLEEARRQKLEAFVQISTDEVYGDVATGHSREDDALRPRSPYAAAKAGGELLARSYFDSHDVPVVITRGSNTFGPRQYPEKLMPLFISNALCDLPLPLYGDGLQKRDWLFVEDHARGVLHAAEHGAAGESYNIGGGNERTNREITTGILRLLEKPETLVRHVADRPGHDRRYSVSSEKLNSLGWQAQSSFEDALGRTVDWYAENSSWWQSIRNNADYQNYYRANYEKRLAGN